MESAVCFPCRRFGQFGFHHETDVTGGRCPPASCERVRCRVASLRNLPRRPHRRSCMPM